jgi:hypothetical protein
LNETSDKSNNTRKILDKQATVSSNTYDD